MAITYVHLLLISCVIISSDCQRLHEQIYSSIQGGAACFRRLNGTHQTGCSSTDKGAFGVVHMVNNISEAQWLAYNASAGPYMAVTATSLFNDVVELLMEHSHNIAGILIYDNSNDSVSSFTQESKCPNEYSSADSQCSLAKENGGSVWNEHGTGLLKRDIPFPIFYFSESRYKEINKIQDCYKRFNMDKEDQKGRPLCSVQLSSFMFAALNSQVCMRRSATSAILTPTNVCDPLGDQNIYYSLFPMRNIDGRIDQSITLVTARIDTASLFDGVSPGAASSVVGMVALISAAATLANLIPLTETKLYDKNVLWTLFNGESFDYIGSQRVAYDIQRGAWPPDAALIPTDIKLHIELGQIGGSLANHKNDTAWPLYGLAYNYSIIPQDISKFITEMYSYGAAYNITISQQLTMSLPPSSLHSFRRILKNETESGQLPELLIVDHEEKFTNLFYNSAFDDYEKIGFVYRNISISNDGTFLSTAELLLNGTMTERDIQVKISRLATILASTLYQRITGIKYEGNVTTSAHLVDEMLYCFLRSQNCRLLLAAEYMQSAGAEQQLPLSQPDPLYVGVATSDTKAPVFAGHLLALLTGTHLHINQADCNNNNDPGFSTYWLRGWNHSGVCIQTTMGFSQAVSPAFVISGYDMKSGVYSTWTESVWHTMWARVFVTAAGHGARAAAISGLMSTVVIAALTYWLRRHSQVIFINHTTGPVIIDDAASGILRTVNC